MTYVLHCLRSVAIAITVQQFEVVVLVNSWICRPATFAVSSYSLGLHTGN